MEYAKKIDSLPARKEGSKVYGNHLWNKSSAAGGLWWSINFPIYYNFNGGKYGLFNESGKDVVFDKPDTKMVDFLKFLNQAQKFSPDSSMSEDFFHRNIGMWMQFDCLGRLNLRDAKDKPMVIGQDVGVAPIPTLKEGDPTWSTLDGKTFMIFKSNPDRQKLAWEFIRFLMQDDINLLTVKSFQMLPTLKSLTNDPYFQSPEMKPCFN